MMTSDVPFAGVTGAAAGIGYELAKCCAKGGFDLLIAADQPSIQTAAQQLRQFGRQVEALEVDLATEEGVQRLYQAIGGRPGGALLANAGQGLGKTFLEQDWNDIRQVIDTNVTGTLALLHKVGRDKVTQGQGRFMITGSIAGFMPGTFQSVYYGTMSLRDSFSFALRS